MKQQKRAAVQPCILYIWQNKEKDKSRTRIGSIYKHYKVMIFTCYHLEAKKIVRMLSRLLGIILRGFGMILK